MFEVRPEIWNFFIKCRKKKAKVEMEISWFIRMIFIKKKNQNLFFLIRKRYLDRFQSLEIILI